MEEMNEKDTVIALFDDNGKPTDFDVLMTFDYEGKHYIALLPMEPVEGVGEDEVILLETKKENGEELFLSIDNPILLDEVFAEFEELFDEQIAENDEEPIE